MLFLIGSRVLGLFLFSAVVCNVESRGPNAVYPADFAQLCSFEERQKTCEDNTKFVLFTRSDRTNGQVLDVTADNIAKTNFNAANPTKFIIHDFMHGIKEASYHYIRTEYLKKGDYNLIMVDWSYLARGPDYCFYRANYYTRHVGKCTAVLINMLREKYGLTDVHVIGLGLGAVTINSIADKVKSNLTRATGLDPNGKTCFNGDRCVKVNALKTSVAVFVDVIHTNSAGPDAVGTTNPVGHVDYYLNDGSHQPGCLANTKVLHYDDSCSHRHSILFFTESINIGKGFYGDECEFLEDVLVTGGKCPAQGPRKILMGEYALNTTRGIVSVPTSKQSPYSLGP